MKKWSFAGALCAMLLSVCAMAWSSEKVEKEFTGNGVVAMQVECAAQPLIVGEMCALLDCKVVVCERELNQREVSAPWAATYEIERPDKWRFGFSIAHVINTVDPNQTTRPPSNFLQRACGFHPKV